MHFASEIKRKSIHLASLAIPIGYYLTPDSWMRIWERALLASVILSLAIEVFRLNHPRTRHVFRHFFGELLRNHEDVSLLGSTYLLIACVLTIHLFPKPVAVLALCFLILGDTVAAIVGKQACALGGLGAPLNRLAIGLGMIPRGEVGLIFANLGLGLTLHGVPVIDERVFSAVVLMVVLTALVTPPALKWSLARGAS